MRKGDFIALLLEGDMNDTVRIMSASEQIDEDMEPDQLTANSYRIVGVRSESLDGMCVILTNAPSMSSNDDID